MNRITYCEEQVMKRSLLVGLVLAWMDVMRTA